jgi:hypothetical protein
MKCIETFARATDYFEGALVLFEKQEVESHLATCEKCRGHFEHIRQMIAAMRSLPEPTTLSPKAKEEILDAFRKQQSQILLFGIMGVRRLAVAAAIGIVLLATVLWVIKTRREAPGTEQGYKELALDLSKRLVLRGSGNPEPGPPLQVPRARLALLIHLPVGSQRGNYEVALQKDEKSLATATGSAQVSDQAMVLRVKLDLSQFSAGEYLLGLRPANRDWRYYKVVLE